MVHREEHNESYTVIDNAVLQNVNISFEARGFLCYLLSLPNDWCFTVRGIVKQTGCSKSVVLRLVDELKAAGYLKLERKQDKQGRFTQSSWHIYESPYEHHNIEKRNTVKTEHGENGTRYLRNTVITEHGENEPIQNNNNNKVLNKQNTKENKVTGRFTAPTVEEVREYCLERGNSVDPDQFVDFYTSKGWKVGKNPMKDWKAAVRTWERGRNTSRPLPRAESNNGNQFFKLLESGGT